MPLADSRRLLGASPDERAHRDLSRDRIGVQRADVEEDVSVDRLPRGTGARARRRRRRASSA